MSTAAVDRLSFTLPDWRAALKRRRTPRPPRFTRKQKFCLAWDVAWLTFNVISGVVVTPPGMAWAAAMACDIRAIFLDASRAARGRPPLRFGEPAMLLPVAFWVLSIGLGVGSALA